jgi:MFS superfamily sulfate permease-like transporter
MDRTSLPSPGFFENIRQDLPASIVVFFVAVPLCLGIALASGAPLFSGIIAGIIGGIVVTTFSGSPLGVSGPAAGLAVIAFAAIEQVGFEAFQVAVVLAGLGQIVLCYARAGFIAYYFPSSVIKGMLSGIGLLILIKQIPHALGFEVQGEIGLFQDHGYVSYLGFIGLFDHISMGALIIWICSMAILMAWETPFFKNKPLFRLIQGPLIVVVSAVLIAKSFEVFLPSLALSSTFFVDVPVSQDISQFFSHFNFIKLSHFSNPEIYKIAIVVALVASIETLLCVEATDKLDPHKRVTPASKELKAQGLGNICSGMIGGLPITQVIVRSSANIQAGARTKASAFFHGIFLLVCVMTIPHWLNMIPFASLAAILMVVGYKLAKPVFSKEIVHLGYYQSAPFFATVIVILTTNLLLGITVGLAASIVFILWENYKNSHYFHKELKNGKILIKLSENVVFLNKANILQTLNTLPNGADVLIDASATTYLDHDVWEILENYKNEAQWKQIQLELIGVTEEKTFKTLENLTKDINGKRELAELKFK